MKLALLMGLGLAFAEVAPTQFWSLERESWNGATVAIEGAEAKVGGYIRNPNVEYDYETLVLPDLSNLSGAVTSAKLSFRSTGGNTGYNNSVVLFEQTNSFDANASLTYDLFGSSFWINNLGSVSVPTAPSNGTWYEIESDALKGYVQGVLNGNVNNGLILTGSFWYWGYTVGLDDVKLEVETESDPEYTTLENLLDFEDRSLWRGGNIKIAVDAANATSREQGFHLTLAPGLSTSGISSNAFQVPVGETVGDKLIINVRSPYKKTELSILFAGGSLGEVHINPSNDFQTIVYPLSQAHQDALETGVLNYITIAPDEVDFSGLDFWVDEIKFPNSSWDELK